MKQTAGKSLTCTHLHSSWIDFPSQSCRPLVRHCITTYPQLRAVAHHRTRTHELYGKFWGVDFKSLQQANWQCVLRQISLTSKPNKPMGSTLAKITELELQAQKFHTLAFLSKKNKFDWIAYKYNKCQTKSRTLQDFLVKQASVFFVLEITMGAGKTAQSLRACTASAEDQSTSGLLNSCTCRPVPHTDAHTYT